MLALGSFKMARKTKKRASKRELIDTGRDKRLVRRGKKGLFKESDDVGRSIAADRRESQKEGPLWLRLQG